MNDAWTFRDLTGLFEFLNPNRGSLPASKRRRAAGLAKRLRVTAGAGEMPDAQVLPPWLPCRDCFAVLDEFGANAGELAIIGAPLAARLAVLVDPDRAPLDGETEEEAISLMLQVANASVGILYRRSWDVDPRHVDSWRS